MARGRRRFGTDKSHGTRTPASAANAPTTGSVSVPELERQIKALPRENADLREQRSILKKAVTIFKGGPAMKIGVIRALAGQHSVRKLCRTLGVARRAGQRCGRRRVARRMRRAGLRAKQKRCFRLRTTDSRHLYPIAPHHLAE